MERRVLKTVKIEVEFEVIACTPYYSFPCTNCCFNPHVNCPYPREEYCKGGYLRVKDNK